VPGTIRGNTVLEVLSETERRSRDGHSVELIRIVRTDFKYPLLRVAETWTTDPVTGTSERTRTSCSVADHVVVRLRPGVSEDQLLAVCRRNGCQIRHHLPLSGLYLVAFDDVDVDAVDRHIAEIALAADVVRDAEPDHIFTLCATIPNDTDFEDLWGMDNTGQSGGWVDADIDAPEAWDMTTGSGAMIVGVIDTGIDIDHPDLAANMWVNPGEIPGNGIDDDGNGYADDVHGWDFYHWDDDPDDDNSHGTHVSGTIGAVGDNNAGVVGVNWHVKLMALKTLGPSGGGSNSDTAEAFAYVTWMRTNGVNIRLTSNSYSDDAVPAFFEDAVQASCDAGMLVVAAAGNHGNSSPHYPAALAFPSVISVAATDHNDVRTGYSAYGTTSVDLGAPGGTAITEILSTTPGGNYGGKYGTSMACPHVAGAAALLWDLMPDRSADQIRDAIFTGVDPVDTLSGITVTGGRLNVYNALLALEPDIIHTPLTNTWNSAPAYAIDAHIAPALLLDTNRLRVAWNLDGNTNAFATNMMVQVSNDLFRALIPTQAVGSVVHYYIHAENTNGVAAVDPLAAPATLHSFRVVDPSRLIVAGSPGNHGTPDPDYGFDHLFPSGLTVNASAPQFTPPMSSHRFRCDGWTGTQDVPPAGTSNSVSFVLHDTGTFSVLTWVWEKQYALVQTSTVQGVVATTSWWDEGATAQTVTATGTVPVGGTNYHFAGWYLDGARVPDPTNRAVDQVTGIDMSAAHTAIALYLAETEDLDGDNVGDWWEYYYLGSTSAVATADIDGDGADALVEYGDRTDPRDTNSVPAGPVVTIIPLADPQTHPAPFTAAARVTDSHCVTAVTMRWWRAGSPETYTAMTPGTGDIYTAEIPAPGTNGNRFTYFVAAWDPDGRETLSVPHDFDVLYPEIHLSPGSATGLLVRPGTVTNIVITVTNSGLLTLNWQAAAAFADSFDTEPLTAWTHGGANDLWHVSRQRPYSGTYSWYCGNQSGDYVNSMDASLEMPEFTVPANARLSLRHWADFENGSPRQDQYWDASVVEISTNGGTSFVSVAPEGGYPFFVVGNPDSPFPPHMPCLGGDGGAWQQAAFDLSSYSGRLATVRFRFGSDKYAIDHGWYIDDVLLVPNPYSNAWLTVDGLSGSVPAGQGCTITAIVDATAFDTGNGESFVRIVTDDPLSPTSTIPVSFAVRSPPTLALTSSQQTSTNGGGLVTVSNRLSDADYEYLGLEFLYSTNAGTAWATAFVFNAGTDLGTVVISNGQQLVVDSIDTVDGNGPATNTLWLEWSTTNGPLAGMLASNVLAKARAWDGIYWSEAVTSSPFRVDNEPPSPLASLDVTTHVFSAWSTNSRVGFLLGAAGDGPGSGLRDYTYEFATGPAAPPAVSGTTTQLGLLGPPIADGSNWWLRAYAVDNHGNRGPATNAGAMWIDSTPPAHGAAAVTHALSAYGDYVVGNVVTSSWSGFADALSGIAGYYVSPVNNGGTTNGTWTASSPAEISGLTPDQTNTVYVWARDVAGVIGNAASSAVLLLDPGSDFDSDSLASGDEEIAGTAADDGNSMFAFLAISNAPPGGGTILEWPAVSNRVYAILYRPSMTVTDWLPLAAVTNVPGFTGPAAYTDEVVTATGRVYRITVSRP